MDRFSRLEFDERKPRKIAAAGESVRDAEFFHKEAMKYWLAADFELALRNFSRMLENNNTLFDAWAGQVLMLIELAEYPEAIVWADKALELFPEHPELFALKAIAYARDARPEKAAAHSDNSISKDKITPRVWLARAEIFFGKKKTIAYDCISKSINLADNSASLMKLEAGRLLNAKGDYTAAVDYLTDAVRVFPKSALAWYELGFCQARLGFPEAEESFSQSVKLCDGWEKPKDALQKIRSRGFFRKLFRR
jgi:tetratricopeptide (TPR) repeat protein